MKTSLTALWQHIRRFGFVPQRPYEVTSPIFHILKDARNTNILGWKPIASLLYAMPAFRKKYTRIDTNERIIEIPWVFSQIDLQRKGKVLDVGWLESTVGISLATAGYKVTGIDLRPGELQHPNFISIAGDICTVPLGANSFDYVILLSTLEHIGLDTIYGSVDSRTTDQLALDVCLRVLKPGGVLLLTTPVAKRAHQDSFMRRYTPAKLQTMLSKWDNVEYSYYAPTRDRQYWQKTSPGALPQPPRFGVALVRAQKPKSTKLVR